MAKFSFILSLLVAAIVALSSTTSAFAPKPAFGAAVRPATTTTELNVKVKVNVGDGEPIESALRRFKRAVNSSGHLMELRHKRYFENPQERKKRKVKEARMRIKFERMNRRRMANRT